MEEPGTVFKTRFQLRREQVEAMKDIEPKSPPAYHARGSIARR